jgi:hypothetical protein
MSVSTAYTPLQRSRLAPPERLHYFMMNALLYSRMEAGYPTNCEFPDEDVNVYIASMLSTCIDSRLIPVHAGIARTDAEIFEKAAQADGIRTRLAIYRRSADTLLLSLGIFRNARGRRPDSVKHMALSDCAYIGRGEMYYAIASSSAAKLERRKSGLAEVLGKLSRGFERYVAVLSYLGGEYLGIMKGMSPGELYHLERSAAAARPRAALAEAYDRFLDYYSSYRRQPSASGKRSLAQAVKDLRALDPSFAFDVELLDRIKSL